MVNKKINDIMYEFADLITYLEIIADYCRYNRNNKQIGKKNCK